MEDQAAYGVPAWIVRRIGRQVELSAPVDGQPVGKRGVLLSIATKTRWGGTGVYCTVGFDLRDIGDETNVDLSALRPPR